jgi:hypothetical protein
MHGMENMKGRWNRISGFLPVCVERNKNTTAA